MSLAFVLAIIFFSVLASVPVAHAAPSIVQHWICANTGSSTNWSCQFGDQNNAVGNLLVFLIGVRNCCSSNPTLPMVTAISDSQGNTITKANGITLYSGDGNNAWDVEIYYTTASAATKDTVSLTVNVGPAQSADDRSILVEVSGTSPTLTGSCTGTTTTFDLECGNSVVTDSTAFDVFMPSQNFGCGGIYSTGYQVIPQHPATPSDNNCPGYSLGTAPSPTTFKYCSGSGCNGAFGQTGGTVGAVFDFLTFSTATTIVPPSVFSINYWIGPLLFLGLYDGLFFGHAALMKVSTKGLIYMLLSGFVMGSLIGFIMGFIGIQLIIMCILVMIIWWYRFR